MENLKMDKLFESYTKRAAQYLNEDDEVISPMNLCTFFHIRR